MGQAILLKVFRCIKILTTSNYHDASNIPWASHEDTFFAAPKSRHDADRRARRFVTIGSLASSFADARRFSSSRVFGTGVAHSIQEGMSARRKEVSNVRYKPNRNEMSRYERD